MLLEVSPEWPTVDGIYEKLDVDEPLKSKLVRFIEKLKDFARASVKRCKERILDEALRLVKSVSIEEWHTLVDSQMLSIAHVVVSMQLETVCYSAAFQRLNQLLLKISEDRPVVTADIKRRLCTVLQTNKIMSIKDLQTACMYLEESCFGREVCRENLPLLLSSISSTLLWVLEQVVTQDDEWCCFSVKICLQVFQLLSEEVGRQVWIEKCNSTTIHSIVTCLVEVLLGKTSNRDTRLLAGTALVMLINTAPEQKAGVKASASLLQLVQKRMTELHLGGLKVSISTQKMDGVERLATARAFLTCGRKDILVGRLDKIQGCLLLDMVFPIVADLCKQNLDCHYYTFQVLALWLKCLKECLPDLWQETGVCILSEDSTLLLTVTELVWNNAENPVEGVSEFVHSSFRLLLEIYTLECEHFADSERPLYHSFLGRVVALPWQNKAKYFPLCALLPYLGTSKILQKFPELPCQLLNSLSTTYLTSCAAEVYKLMIHHQRLELRKLGEANLSEAVMAAHWAASWLSTLSEALTSEITLMHNNAANYLLPCTLRTFPATFEILCNTFTLVNPGHLRASMTILKTQRSVAADNLILQGATLEKVHLCLHSLDDSVRLGVLGFLSSCPKTNQPVSMLELDLLKEFLPLNLNCESSPFRQHLQVGVKKVLVRIRDSCLVHLRNKTARAQNRRKESSQGSGALDNELIQGIGFVDWLVQLSISSLAPNLNFQRKKTALLILSAVLETCTDSWVPDKKKGQPPVDISALINWSKERGYWDFFSEVNLWALFGCLQDSTNEIREMTADLLVKFFPCYLPQPFMGALVDKAHRALLSPRVHDAEAGALMMQLVLQKSRSLEFLFEISSENTEKASSSVENKAVFFLLYLIKELEEHCNLAKTDMLLAARSKPIHGVIAALQRCIAKVPDVLVSIQKRQTTPDVPDILDKLIGTICSITFFILKVLYGKECDIENQEAPPSFADMGKAIYSLIAEGKALDQLQEEDSVLLSEDHGLILTCCWVTVKEIGILLGTLVDQSLSRTPVTSLEELLSVDMLKKIANLFQDLLLKCRHWGAVEGCCIGFTKFCSVLLNHSNQEIQEIPKQILEQALSVLKMPRNSSVTRRAAGLPMLIMCVITGEDPSRSRPLLSLCMKMLLAVANTPLPKEWDHTLDLPQVCSLHVMQTLVRGSGLGVAVLQFATPMTVLSLNALSSPCWAMRNAALQLFSSLCVRLMGQRWNREDNSVQNGMSPSAFFTHYSLLRDFFLQELKQASITEPLVGEGKLLLTPSLHSVLTLLAKLQPGFHDNSDAVSGFIHPLLTLAGSPLYAVRVMAARSLIPMVSASSVSHLILQLIEDLPSEGNAYSHNELHGRLLQTKTLLHKALKVNRFDPSAILNFMTQFESKFWLVTRSQRCPLNRFAYLEVAALLIEWCGEGFTEQLHLELQSELLTPPCKLQVGAAIFRQAAAQFLCSEAIRTGDVKIADYVCQLMISKDIDIRLSVAAWIVKEQTWKGTYLGLALQETLKKFLKNAVAMQKDVAFLKAYLEAFVTVVGEMEDVGVSSDSSVHKSTDHELSDCAETLISMLESRLAGPDLLAHALCASSLLLLRRVDDCLLQRWCSVLEEHALPQSFEILRFSAAKSLRFVGVSLLHHFSTTCVSHATLALRLINASILMLQDEDARVRAEAAEFVSSLTWERWNLRGICSCLPVQANKALLYLLDYLLDEFWENRGTLDMLLSHLPQVDLKRIFQDLEGPESITLYEQDETNVFAEPAVISKMLLPYICRLSEKMATNSQLREYLKDWVTTNKVVILNDMEYTRHWFTQECVAPSYQLRALCCPHMRTALNALLVKSTVVLHSERVLQEDQGVKLAEAHTILKLQQEMEETQRVLAQKGILLLYQI
uniref:Si:ch211-225b11.4 n=1 Tax=Erpetoichthys calabaricus TaxID=27687 RepID=A0A8C4SWM5_ERPCA